ncbi:hypothetical protein [Streptomyces omiyaensis]|uniref:Uncharacterized protein n=1 Tax=Streptomyces omiyaensis TaxID=68247 RepID=A0ABW7BZ59_9ACTN|nr:hypothetical protein [Streptomyces omiyaensis]GGY64821.1 hypothetical protein GCM10010363_52770 [Streptomyces omiyaensis]
MRDVYEEERGALARRAAACGAAVFPPGFRGRDVAGRDAVMRVADACAHVARVLHGTPGGRSRARLGGLVEVFARAVSEREGAYAAACRAHLGDTVRPAVEAGDLRLSRPA